MKTALNQLKGKRICLRCGHLNNGVEDFNKKICLCGNPVLVPAGEITTMGIPELRRKYNFDPKA